MYQKLQQSVGPIHTVDDLIHVLHWRLTKLLHHEEDIDEESTEDLEEMETVKKYSLPILFINVPQNILLMDVAQFSKLHKIFLKSLV